MQPRSPGSLVRSVRLGRRGGQAVLPANPALPLPPSQPGSRPAVPVSGIGLLSPGELCVAASIGPTP